MRKKSFILYSEVELGDDLVDCIYLFKDECRAQPIVDKKEGYYKPTGEDKAHFCSMKAMDFRSCPRFQAYQDHLRAIGLNPEEHTSV
jgi:hypothetical protein